MFLFYSEKAEINSKEYNLFVHVRNNINSKNEVFELFPSQLRFPTYFGKTWDAFYDCLCSLDYPNTTKILILHEDLPFKESEMDRTTYMDILSDVESDLKENDYKIDVAFPIKYKEIIINS